MITAWLLTVNNKLLLEAKWLYNLYVELRGLIPYELWKTIYEHLHLHC